MPDISEVNGTAISNLAEVDGLTVSGGGAFLLDQSYASGAEAAYSVRQLRTGETISMRVRRDTGGGAGDDDEADVAFDTFLSTPTISLNSAISNASSGVTATTLGQFINVGTVNGTTYTNPDSLTVTASCFVDEWKDQSGNGNDAEQNTAGSQPQIHSGTVNTDLITNGGKPALQGGRYEAVSGITLSSDWSSFEVYNSNGDQTFCTYGGGPSSAYAPISINNLSAAGYRDFGVPSFYKNGSSITISTMDDAHTELAINSTLLLSIVEAGTSTWGNFYINSFNNGSFTFGGLMQEQIFFGVDNISNRSDIETNINNYFSIY